MDQVKRERLEAKGWKVSTVSDFLELAPQESILTEIKSALTYRTHLIFKKAIKLKAIGHMTLVQHQEPLPKLLHIFLGCPVVPVLSNRFPLLTQKFFLKLQ
jgi:hypothetical protein